MPYVKISDLPAVSMPLDGTELLEIVQEGVSKRVAVEDLLAQPIGWPMFVPGTMTDDMLIFVIVPNFAMTIPADLAGTTVRLTDNPSAATTITLNKNGSSFGTVAIATDGTVTLASATGASFNGTTDELSVTGPATADTTLTNLGIMLKGWR